MGLVFLGDEFEDLVPPIFLEGDSDEGSRRIWSSRPQSRSSFGRFWND